MGDALFLGFLFLSEERDEYMVALTCTNPDCRTPMTGIRLRERVLAMSAGMVGHGWGGGMDREPGAGPPGIDRDLELIAAGLSELRGLASDPQKSGDDDRVYDLGVRWGVLMSGRLKRLEHYRRRRAHGWAGARLQDAQTVFE